MAGCGASVSSDPQAAGNGFTAGPSAVATPTAGPGVPTPVATAPPTPTTAPGTTDPPAGRIKTIADFETLLTNAIYDKQRKGRPSLHVERRKYAQYQFIVKWQVSTVAEDPVAARLAAQDAVRVLTFVKKADLPVYGSVLLLISARVDDRKNGATIVSQVVRAKYSAAAVKGTVFDVRKVWRQTDDKPATVHPAFKLNGS
ncbi:hypothetical protein [Actinocorallia lasiicapitis]